jgi:hypothetical protein
MSKGKALNKVYLVLTIIIVVLSVALVGVLSQQNSQRILTNPLPTSNSSPITSVSPKPTMAPSSKPTNGLAPSTEQKDLTIFNIQFIPQNVVTMYLVNTGTYDVKIDKVLVDNSPQSGVFIYSTGSSIIPANSQATLSFNYNWQRDWGLQVGVETINGKGISFMATP